MGEALSPELNQKLAMRGAIFETRAEIYWRTEGDALVWTKGFVMFIGL